MEASFTQLRNKEMICVKDGFKIGYVDDVEFDPESMKLLRLVSYGKSRWFGLLGRQEDTKIPCDQIKVIGEDIILVKEYCTDRKNKSRKDSFWTRLLDI